MNLIDVNDEPPRFTSPFGYIAIFDEDEQVGNVVFSSVNMKSCADGQYLIIYAAHRYQLQTGTVLVE